MRKRRGRWNAGLLTRMRTNPEELLLALIFALSGVIGLVGQVKSDSLAALLPTWLVHVASAELIIAGLLISVGMFLRGRRVEIAGLYVMAFVNSAYALAVFAYAGERALLSVLILGAYAASCAARAHGLVRVHRQLEFAQHTMNGDGDEPA